MKKRLLLFSMLFSTVFIFSQTNRQKATHYLKERGELAFTFTANTKEEVQKLALIISFDHSQDQNNPFKVNAIANEEEFDKFLEFNLPFTVDSTKNEPKQVKMYEPSTSLEDRTYVLSFPLNAYPTYAQYTAQMAAFAADNPSIAQLVNIGSSVNGKDLLFIKLSDNVTTHEQEPRLLYTSSMHGDEIAGYPMMLSLIDFFITTYNDVAHPRHTEIKNLIDNSEIWINPMANPDGTFYGDWTNYADVSGARRTNANNIDLNRNYPDPKDGAHPDGQVYQSETTAFMTMADTYHFVVSANFHGGAEVFNYPWDTYTTAEGRHTDDSWYEYIGVEYATHAQNNSPSGYFTYDPDGGSPGVTHGATWYRVAGGRQDYMNYDSQCRESTMELSDAKIIPSNQIQDHWNYNRDALIDLLKQGVYGFNGLVKDADTGNPIKAKITIIGMDDQVNSRNSWVETELPIGDYYRPIQAGTYDILYEADCYQSFTLTNQTITDLQTVNLPDVLLVSNATPSNLSASNITSNSADLNWDGALGSTYNIRYRINGTSTWTNTTSATTTLNIAALASSTTYEYQVQGNCGSITSSYTSSTTFTTLAFTYCSSNGNNTTDEYIGNVTIGTINNNSGVGTTSTGYSDFTAQSTDLDIDAAAPTVSVTKIWTGTAYSEAVSVWIDFNQDGDFNDAGENVFNDGPNNTATVSGVITIPSIASGTVLGNTRMRVSMKYNAAPTDPCESFSYGEVEDYTVNLYSSVLGVNNPSAILNAINIYPNPANEQIIVNTPTNINLLDYRLSNAIGQSVMINKFLNENKIDVSELQTGIYFLSINTNKGKITKKIVIE